MNKNEYININKVAEAKGLKSNRSLRLEINKPESKYVAREVKVNGGTSYEILYSSLEPEILQKLNENSTKSTALVPLNYQPTTFVSESARLTSLARLDIVKALLNYRKRFSTKKEADSMFLDLYNSGMYLPKVFKFIGTISIGTLHRWVKSYERYENAECLIPQYKFNKQGEYNTILTDEMKHILLRFLLHQNKFNYGKAIKLTKEILRKQGYENLPCDLTFKRYAENFRKNNYAEWVLKREGMKAYHDKVEPYIERDISKIEVGDIIIADGHVLNFQVINPFNDRSKSIQEMLNSVEKQHINIKILNTLMMKTECRTITKHGITFLNMHYRSEAILGLREQVFIRYSLFDLSKIFVYSSKGEFLCVAKRVQKVHPMANVLGTVKDMEEYKQQYKKQQQIKNRLVKQIKKNFTSDELQVLEIEQEQSIEIEPIIEEKPKRERVKTPREQQMNRPIFTSNYEKYEWLMKNGCTNTEDRTWLTQYIRSDEYINIYGD